MPALRTEAAWAEKRLLGSLRQPVCVNGRVHLRIIERRGGHSMAVLAVCTEYFFEITGVSLLARAIRNAIRANRFARIIRI